MVGDYLFSDKNFITHLTSNRNVFQKVYDEIKYLWNVATGKEKAQIEKVKREFDKVWKEQGQKPTNKDFADPDVKYSVSADSEGNQLSKEQSEYFKDGKVVDDNGNLKVMYHTTGNDFTVFDKARKGEPSTVGTPLKDLYLEQVIAPVREDVAENATTTTEA